MREKKGYSLIYTLKNETFLIHKCLMVRIDINHIFSGWTFNYYLLWFLLLIFHIMLNQGVKYLDTNYS